MSKQPHCGNCIWWDDIIVRVSMYRWGYCDKHEKETPDISSCPKWIQNPAKEDGE